MTQTPTGRFFLINKDIAIDQKTLVWKTWFERGIYFVQDLLSTEGKFFISSEFLFSTPDLIYLFEDNTLPLSKMRCKRYYKLFLK